METRVGALACAIALAGCGDNIPARDYPEKPGQAEALAIAGSVFGMDATRVPVEWATDVLDCEIAGVTYQGFRVDVGDVALCAPAWTFEDPLRIKAVWLGSFSSSHIPHEFGHVDLVLTTGTGDGGDDHANTAGPTWGPGGLVDRAAASLVAAGH